MVSVTKPVVKARERKLDKIEMEEIEEMFKVFDLDGNGACVQCAPLCSSVVARVWVQPTGSLLLDKKGCGVSARDHFFCVASVRCGYTGSLLLCGARRTWRACVLACVRAPGFFSCCFLFDADIGSRHRG